MKNPEIEGQIINFEKKEEENQEWQEWMRTADGETLCPQCWPKKLQKIKDKTLEIWPDDESKVEGLVKGFIEDSRTFSQVGYFPAMEEEWCEDCGTRISIPEESLKKLKKAAKKLRQKQRGLENNKI